MSRAMVEGGGTSCFFVLTPVLPIDRSTFCAFSTTQWISRAMYLRVNEYGGRGTVMRRLVENIRMRVV